MLLAVRMGCPATAMLMEMSLLSTRSEVSASKAGSLPHPHLSLSPQASSCSFRYPMLLWQAGGVGCGGGSGIFLCSYGIFLSKINHFPCSSKFHLLPPWLEQAATQLPLELITLLQVDLDYHSWGRHVAVQIKPKLHTSWVCSIEQKLQESKQKESGNVKPWKYMNLS